MTVIDQTADHVRTVLTDDSAGHDWWHVYRVWKMARQIGREEKVDLVVTELAALLHDIADWKFHGGDTSAGPRKAKDWFDSLAVDSAISAHVCQIIDLSCLPTPRFDFTDFPAKADGGKASHPWSRKGT
jgi:uncharacterized protein